MKRKLRAYISCPVDPVNSESVRRPAEAFLALTQAGCAPLCPNADWTVIDLPAIDLAWVDVCDFVVRLPGESKGADAEVARAYERGIPVFFNLNSALLYAEAASATFLNVKAGAA